MSRHIFKKVIQYYCMNDELEFNIEEYPYFCTHKVWNSETKSYTTVQGLYEELTATNSFYYIFQQAMSQRFGLETISTANMGLTSYLGYIIHDYYHYNFYSKSPQVAIKFIDFTVRLSDCRNEFANAILGRLLPHYEEWNNKYNILTFFGNLTKDELLAINSITDTSTNDSSQTGESSEDSVGGNNVLQKYASSPTAVSPSESDDTLSINTKDGTFGATGFQSKYQNTSANTEQLNKNKTTRSNSATRKGTSTYTRIHKGNISLLTEIYNKLPKGFVDEVLETVAPLFITVE